MDKVNVPDQHVRKQVIYDWVQLLPTFITITRFLPKFFILTWTTFLSAAHKSREISLISTDGTRPAWLSSSCVTEIAKSTAFVSVAGHRSPRHGYKMKDKHSTIFFKVKYYHQWKNMCISCLVYLLFFIWLTCFYIEIKLLKHYKTFFPHCAGTTATKLIERCYSSLTPANLSWMVFRLFLRNWALWNLK